MFLFQCRNQRTNPVPALQSSSEAAELSSALPVPAWCWGRGKQDFPGIRSLQVLWARVLWSSGCVSAEAPGRSAPAGFSLPALTTGHSPAETGGSLVLWEAFELTRAVTGGLWNKHWNEIHNTSTESMHYLQCSQTDTVAVLTPECLFSGWCVGGRKEEQPPRAPVFRLLGPGG